MRSNKEREDAWLQVAQSLASHPSHFSRTGLFVFAGLAVATLPLPPLALYSGATWAGFALLGLPALMTGFALYQWRRLARAGALQQSFRSRAEQRGGHVADGQDTARWLVQHWDGEYPDLALAQSPEILRATLPVAGADVLIDCTPNGYTTAGGETGRYYWWARVVVPAARPIVGVRLNPDHPYVQRIKARGYEPECESGGLIAHGSDALSKAISRAPATTLEIFDVADELVELKNVVEATMNTETPAAEVPVTLPWSGERSYAATQRQVASDQATGTRTRFLLVLLVLALVVSAVGVALSFD